MTEFLKLPQLPQRHRVAQVHVDTGGIDSIFHAQRLAGPCRSLQLCDQFLLRHDLFDPATDDL
jgi:hypothetical protein